MHLSPDMKRMDSLTAAAGIKKLSVLELSYTCAANPAKITVRRKTTLPEEQSRCTEKDDCNRSIYHKRELDAAEQTTAAVQDAEKLIEIRDKTGGPDDPRFFADDIMQIRFRHMEKEGHVFILDLKSQH